jgi:hypothetical protein
VKKLLILAIFLRLLVAAFYFHPDIKTFNFQSSFLKKGVIDIYSYLVNNKENLPFKEEFVYFPLSYFTLGGYQIVASPVLGSGFNAWLNNASSNSFVTDPSIYKYLVVLKLPYLLLDIGMAFLIREFFKDKKKRNLAFTLWLFNPFTIFLIYAYSNVDIFPVALTLLSFLFLRRGKSFPAALSLGIAAGFKLYPLLIIPFLFLYGKTLKEKLILSITPLVIFLAICAPFFSAAFVHSALISGLSTGIFKSEFVTLGISILFFYGLIFDKKMKILNYWVALFLIVFSFALFHIQWLLWLAPFLVIIAVRKPYLAVLIFMLAIFSFSIPILYQDRFMTLGLLRAYSVYFDLLPTPFVVIQKIYDPYNLQSILQSVLAGGSLILTYRLFKQKQ